MEYAYNDIIQYYTRTCITFFYHRRVLIVTGRTELELPDTRKRMGNKASYVDVYPFIWNEFKKHGYVTGEYNI